MVLRETFIDIREYRIIMPFDVDLSLLCADLHLLKKVYSKP